MDPIPLNAVRAAAADVAADTSGTAVAASVADIAGAAADIVADARAAALADAAADVATAVDSAGDLYRRACHVRRHCGLHVPRSARRFWLRSQRPGHGCLRSRALFNGWGGWRYDDSVPGEVTIIAPSGDRTT